MNEKRQEKYPVFVFYLVAIENVIWGDIHNYWHVLRQMTLQRLLNSSSHFTYSDSGPRSWAVHALIHFWVCWLLNVYLSTQEIGKMIDHKQYCCSSRYMTMYLTCFMFPGGINENSGKCDLPHVITVLLMTDIFLLFAHFYL